MEHLILAFYILFFASGFMGAAALLLLGLRERGPLLGLLLAFQLVFLLGLGIVGSYFYISNLAFAGAALPPRLETLFGIASSLVNAAIYLLAILTLRRLEPRSSRRPSMPAAAELLALLVIFQIIVTLALALAAGGGASSARALLDSEEWHLGGYLLTALAIGAFGFSLRGAASERASAALGPLLRGYGLCALAFAPLGFLEFLLNNLGLQPWCPLSLDYLFYLGWNFVSMGAALRALGRREAPAGLSELLGSESVRALGLTAREEEMARLIARGLANKEIAAELGISAATVRTHIYNLYQKVGARSRVELLNRLREGAEAT